MWCRAVAALIFLTSVCLSQDLPEPGKPASPYTDGEFTEPRGSQASYRLGATMNISWHTTYETSNLWLIIGWNFNSPVQLASNTGQNWYQWEVATDSKNYSETYAFRAVDATGTEDEQKYGGFLSAAFWIEGLQTISSSMSPNITRVSTSASAPVTMSETATSTAGTTQTAETTAKIEPTSITEDSKIGIGVGVGVGGIGIIALVVGILLCRRSRNKKIGTVNPMESYSRMEQPFPSSSQAYIDTRGSQPYNAPQKWAGPMELEGRRGGFTPEPNPYNSRRIRAAELQG